MEILEKIKSEIAAFDEKRKELLANLKNDFAPMVAPLFEKHPKIKSISWNQYTPYFNDGDECTFSANLDLDYGMKVNGVDEDDDNSPLDWRIKYYLKGEEKYKDLLTENPNIDLEIYHGAIEFQQLLKSIPESFLKDLFGDHMQITLLSTGEVETEEYEHD